MARNHDEMRAIIVDAAREVFSKFGYKKATLDDIASSLYKVKSSIYYYFKSKEDVFRAVLEYEVNRARRIITEAVERETTPEARLRAHFITVYQFITETQSYYNLLQEEMLEVMSFSDEVKKQHHRESVAFIAGILDEGNALGDFTVGDREYLAETMIMAFDGIFMPVSGHGETSIERCELLIDVFLYGIRKR